MVSFKTQVKVSQQDGSPIQGTKAMLTVRPTITYELPEPKTTPLYYWGPRTSNYFMAEQTFTVPDTSVVPVQIVIPDNATSVSLQVSLLIDVPRD